MQENCNLLISNEYSEKTRRAVAMMSEREHSFELIEVFFSVVTSDKRGGKCVLPTFVCLLARWLVGGLA